jgi:hypothetical protein
MESIGMPAASGRDYGTGLVLFGLLELLIGLLFLAKAVLFALLSIPGVMPSVGRFGGDVPLTALLALAPAAFFVALGFGSIAARRWARALALAFSLVWLAIGILCLAFGLLWVPKIIAAIPPAAGEAARSARQTAGALVRAGVIAMTAAFLLPAVSALFYGNAGVARECERRDPQARWTDRVPTGVLALIVVLGLAALLAFQIGFSTARQRLYFGHALGIAPRAGWAALGVAEIGVAWGLARMRRWAWPASLGVIVIRGAASFVVTRRLADAPDAMRIFAPGRTADQSRALLGAVRILRPFDALTLFFAVLSASALALAIGVGPAFRRRADPERAPD